MKSSLTSLFIFALGIIIQPLSAFSEQQGLAKQQEPAEKRELIMGTSNGPPYMIQSTDSGLDIEIPRAALEKMGYTVKVRYMSLARAMLEVRSKRIDFMAPLFAGEIDGVYSSQPHIMYRPTAFSMAEKSIRLKTLNDLGRYRLMTFQGAKGYFGPGFASAAEASPSYMEIHNMMNLARLLYANRTEVVVLDYRIFQYLKQQLPQQLQQRQLTTHDIFPRVPAIVAFNDKTLRDTFNQGLNAIKADGTYDKIISAYGSN